MNRNVRDATLVTRKKLVAVFLLAVVVLFFAYRYTTVPSHLEIRIKLSLSRTSNSSSGYIEAVLLRMARAPTELFDNVSLAQAFENNQTSGYSWTVEIVINDTLSVPMAWSHKIVPSTRVAGRFVGTIVHSIQVSDQFKLWVILYGEEDGAEKVADSRSEYVFMS